MASLRSVSTKNLALLLRIANLGTIQVLRQHVFGFFRPTHPPTRNYVSINSTVNQQKLPFSDPTHPLLCWRNTWMVPWCLTWCTSYSFILDIFTKYFLLIQADEIVISSAFGQMDAVDVTAPSVEFDLASLIGRMAGSQQCKTIYSRCAVTPQAMMEGIRKAAFAKKN